MGDGTPLTPATRIGPGSTARAAGRLLLAVALVAALAACGLGKGAAGSGRPQPTARGVPTGPTAAASIGASGGTITSPSGALVVTVPAGAVSSTTSFVIEELTNTAPGAVGTAYRLLPETTFPSPVTLTFHVDAAAGDLTKLAVAYQDGGGYWMRVAPVTHDAAARTLSFASLHFSDWSVVTGTNRDLRGFYTIQTTLGAIPFQASGDSMLSYAGEDAAGSYYIQSGTLTVASFANGNAVCNAQPAAVPIGTNIADLMKSPATFGWGVTGVWSASCFDATTTTTTTPTLTAVLDTYGINYLACTRGWVGTPTLTTDVVHGTYRIDCGASGYIQSVLDFQTCNAGAACQPTNVCKNGQITCDTGRAVCSPTTDVTNGTSCGTNLVCNAGTCSSCQAGVACSTNPDPCLNGVTSCSTGTSQCVDDPTSPKSNGTTCGSNQVCNGGVCSTCVAGGACTTNPNECYAGVTSCATGSQTCIDNTAAPDLVATPCTGGVCNGSGVCNACTAGLACTTNPNECYAGVTSCATGSQTCVDNTAAPDLVATPCTGGVCNGSGVCNPCTAGLACTTNPNECYAGLTSCATGAETCVDDTAHPDAVATACTGGVCDGNGVCNPCVAGASCQPTSNVCHVGSVSCSTGSAQCTDTGASVQNGTGCGTGQTCNAGTCVASRTVSGTRLLTSWPDAGAQAAVAAPDVAPVTVAQVQALAPSASGWVTYAGTFTVDGGFTISNVPTGSYLLLLRDGAGALRGFDTTSSTVDLGYDLLGRPDAVAATSTTPVTVTLDGILGWAAGDEIQLTSSNADVWDVPIASAALTPGATTAAVQEDWLASSIGRPLDLLATADVVVLHQLDARTSPGGVSYVAAGNAGSVTGVALTNGTAGAITATLSPAPQTGAVGVTWTVSAFDALRTAINPSASAGAGAHTLVVGANAFPLVDPAPVPVPGVPILFRMQRDAGTADLAEGTLAYGQFLGPLWSEWRGVQFDAEVAYTATGASTAWAEHGTIGCREAMASATTPIAPRISPPQAPLVNGLDAFATQVGVGTTPTLSWTAPATGAPTRYTVTILHLTASAGASAATQVATFVTASTSVSVPSGLLQAGEAYYARIVASAPSGTDRLATAPLRSSNAGCWATALTGTFTP